MGVIQKHTKMSDQHENRVKIVYIDQHLIVDMLNGFKVGTILQLPVIDGLPEGTRVQDVFYDWSRRAFAVRLSHESWPIVPGGERIPVVDENAFIRREMLVRVPCEVLERPAPSPFDPAQREKDKTAGVTFREFL